MWLLRATIIAGTQWTSSIKLFVCTNQKMKNLPSLKFHLISSSHLLSTIAFTSISMHILSMLSTIKWNWKNENNWIFFLLLEISKWLKCNHSVRIATIFLSKRFLFELNAIFNLSINIYLLSEKLKVEYIINTAMIAILITLAADIFSVH